MFRRPSHTRAASAAAQFENIRAIAELELAALANRSIAERLSVGVTRVLGSGAFLLLHLAWFTLWILAGINAVPFVPVIDPFPYGLLTMIVSLEAIVLSIFVLISQNQMSRTADRRTHLDLQINVLAEQEITAVLKMVREIHDHLGIASRLDDKEIERHSEPTDLKHLSTELERRLPQE